MYSLRDRSTSDSGSSGRSEVEPTGSDSRPRTNSSKKTIDLIRRADNKIRLLDILRSYGLNISKSNPYSDWSDSIVCPFPSHKGGRERTASFGYNFKTDMFHCFGCSASGRTCGFISLRSEIPVRAVAEQIIRDTVGYETDDEEYDDDNPRIDQFLFGFSKYIQNLTKKHKDSPDILEQINKVTWWFDMYLIAKVPVNKIIVEELGQRITRAKELLSKYE